MNIGEWHKSSDGLPKRTVILAYLQNLVKRQSKIVPAVFIRGGVEGVTQMGFYPLTEIEFKDDQPMDGGKYNYAYYSNSYQIIEQDGFFVTHWAYFNTPLEPDKTPPSSTNNELHNNVKELDLDED